jgi:hypothetical protein
MSAELRSGELRGKRFCSVLRCELFSFEESGFMSAELRGGELRGKRFCSVLRCELFSFEERGFYERRA